VPASERDTNDVVEWIVRLPQTVRACGTPPYTALLESGYVGHARDIGETQIRSCLARSPALADEWLRWSEDKRTASGWYLRQGERGYEVGCVGGASREPVTSTDKLAACAKFIKDELDDMVESARRTS
jgi:hypothetical protein